MVADYNCCCCSCCTNLKMFKSVNKRAKAKIPRIQAHRQQLNVKSCKSRAKENRTDQTRVAVADQTTLRCGGGGGCWLYNSRTGSTVKAAVSAVSSRQADRHRSVRLLQSERTRVRYSRQTINADDGEDGDDDDDGDDAPGDEATSTAEQTAAAAAANGTSMRRWLPSSLPSSLPSPSSAHTPTRLIVATNTSSSMSAASASPESDISTNRGLISFLLLL